MVLVVLFLFTLILCSSSCPSSNDSAMAMSSSSCSFLIRSSSLARSTAAKVISLSFSARAIISSSLSLVPLAEVLVESLLCVRCRLLLARPPSMIVDRSSSMRSPPFVPPVGNDDVGGTTTLECGAGTLNSDDLTDATEVEKGDDGDGADDGECESDGEREVGLKAAS